MNRFSPYEPTPGLHIGRRIVDAMRCVSTTALAFADLGGGDTQLLNLNSIPSSTKAVVHVQRSRSIVRPRQLVALNQLIPY